MRKAVAMAAALALSGAGCGSCTTNRHDDSGGGGSTDAGGPPACADGVDNDGDALVDFPADPGCVDGADDDETEAPACGDELDNDADGLVDLADPGCTSTSDTSEANPECSDGIDNDGDGATDFPADPDCAGVTDEREAMDPVCNDMFDNDGDALVDFPADPGCDDATDPSESDIPDCAGLLPVTDMTATGLLTGTSATGDPSLFTGSCGGAGPEGVGLLSVPVTLSLLSVNTFGTTFSTVIYVETACGDSGTELDCATGAVGNLLELTSVAAGDYFLFADASTAADAGAWYLHAFGIIAPGQTCVPGDQVFRCDSTTGQICSEPIAGLGFVCNAGQCSDGFDNDGDAITDYPWDCGCAAPDDNDETDPASTPQCCDGLDNDTDLFTDYPADPGCNATGDVLELDDCIAGVPVNSLDAMGRGIGMTTGVSNFEGSCTASFTPSGPEAVYGFDLAFTADVTITTNRPGTTFDTGLYVRTVCDSTASELGCNDNEGGGFITTASTLTFPAMAPGTYFVFVDGMAGAAGSYELQVSGVYVTGSPCDPAVVNFSCDALNGDTCQDPGGTGAFTCMPAVCNDGADNDGDAVTDYPAEPGCTAPADGDETDPIAPATCANGADDDGDALTDYPADPGCLYAADATELNVCGTTGVSLLDLPPSGLFAGSIVSFSGTFEGTCSASFCASSGEDVFIVHVPGSATVTFTTDLSGTSVDTVLYLRSTCDLMSSELACNDNVPPGFIASEIVIALAAGDYFLFVDAICGGTGPYQLGVSGALDPGEPCDPTSVVFTCGPGTTCTDVGGGLFSCL
ncbi:MAG TPA: hypothetical protein VG389_05070 [Myxococcota bacterium]|jgi:hypothetical protein|nr:hypothetical protein [Myxococcota bacterium]